MTSGVGRLRGWIVGALAAPLTVSFLRKQESMERAAGVEASVGPCFRRDDMWGVGS